MDPANGQNSERPDPLAAEGNIDFAGCKKSSATNNYRSKNYEESKERRSRKRKRSRSSKKYSKYSSKYTSKHSDKPRRDDSYREKRRDKKHRDKYRDDEFKVPNKHSNGLHEHKKKTKHSHYDSSDGDSWKSSSYNNYSCSRTNKSKDEEHYAFEPGEVLLNRYKIVKHLGDGTFGRVYEVSSLRSGEHYACKIIRAVPRYIKSAKIEAKILCNVKDKASGVVRVKNFFSFRKSNRHPEQYSLIFEKLGKSLYQYLEENEFRGFHLNVIQHFARQILECLKDLKKNLGLIHTDLKPENLLLVNDRTWFLNKIEYLPLQANNVNDKISWKIRKDGTISYEYSNKELEKLLKNPYKIPYYSEIKIVDFGSATYETENWTGIINTRQYRGPEVMLSWWSWNDKSDIWSLGWILAELYTGNQLFPTHETIEHLDMIDKMWGPYPSWMKDVAPSDIKKDLAKIPTYGRRAKELHTKYKLKGFKKLKEIILPEHREFRKFIESLITIDPRKRPSAREALTHKFLTMEIPAEYEEFRKNFESKSTKQSSSVPKTLTQ